MSGDPLNDKRELNLRVADRPQLTWLSIEEGLLITFSWRRRTICSRRRDGVTPANSRHPEVWCTSTNPAGGHLALTGSLNSSVPASFRPGNSFSSLFSRSSFNFCVKSFQMFLFKWSRRRKEALFSSTLRPEESKTFADGGPDEERSEDASPSEERPLSDGWRVSADRNFGASLAWEGPPSALAAAASLPGSPGALLRQPARDGAGTAPAPTLLLFSIFYFRLFAFGAGTTTAHKQDGKSIFFFFENCV